MKNQSSVLLAEYRYNGLGHMIGVHEDTDADGDCDGSDVWFYPAYDEAWREVARYRDTDSSPKEQFVNAMAGLDGYGGSSYINDVVCRERDNTGGWLAASDGTLEERYYYCPNWRGDVSVLVHSGRYMAEWVKYSAYGVPFGLPGGDTNSDGDNDAADATQIQTWINASAYDVRGDVDLDGDVDSTDKTLAQGAPIGGTTLGLGAQSPIWLGYDSGFQGSALLSNHMLHARSRTLAPARGCWDQRDPIGYRGSRGNLYAFVGLRPIAATDVTGLYAEKGGSGGKAKCPAVDCTETRCECSATAVSPSQSGCWLGYSRAYDKMSAEICKQVNPCGNFTAFDTPCVYAIKPGGLFSASKICKCDGVESSGGLMHASGTLNAAVASVRAP